MNRTRIIMALLLAGFVGGCHNGSGQASAGGSGETSGDSLAASDLKDQMKLVASGTGKQLMFKAPHYGRLYLFDAADGQFVYQGYVTAGEQFVFEPASSRATINKQTIDLDRGTNERDEYRLYFAPE